MNVRRVFGDTFDPPRDLDESDVLERAEQDFTSAVTIDPQNTTAFMYRGRARAMLGELGSAIQDVTAAIRIDPTAGAYRTRGSYWWEKKEFDRAIADFRNAVQLDAADHESHACLACIFATGPQTTTRDGKQAIEHAARACSLLQSENPLYLGILAAAYAESGDFEQAVKWQAKALELAMEHEKPDFQKNLDLFKSRHSIRDQRTE